MDASGQNYKDTFRYTDVEYTPDGHTDVYRWDDFLGIAGGWDGSCLNRLDWFEDAVDMDPDGLSAGLVANDIESVKALVGNCPAWIECAPSYSEKAARGVDDVVQAVKAYRANAIRVDRKVIPGRIPERLFEGARTAAANTAGGADGGTGLHI